MRPGQNSAGTKIRWESIRKGGGKKGEEGEEGKIDKDWKSERGEEEKGRRKVREEGRWRRGEVIDKMGERRHGEQEREAY